MCYLFFDALFEKLDNLIKLSWNFFQSDEERVVILNAVQFLNTIVTKK